MIVLMGGSGSTGSSMLKNVLNRHSAIFAGEESNFFCKKELYTDFSKHKHRIKYRGIRGLRNHGWHIYNGIDLYTPEYNLDEVKLTQMVTKATSFVHLSNELKQHFDNPIWLEKTPANATCFANFLNHFEEKKVIHLVRNPYDTIASLVDRGYSLLYAVGIYLINTSAGLSVTSNQDTILVKYEDLVTQPNKVVQTICSSLGIDFDPNMLDSQKEKVINSQLPGWNYDETSAIGMKSVGRFQKLDASDQDKIISAINSIRISEAGWKLFNCNIDSIEEICTELDYDYIPAKGNKYSLRYEIMTDRIHRLRRGYLTGFQYPLSQI